LLRSMTNVGSYQTLRFKRRRSRNARAACQSAKPTQRYDELLAPTNIGS
jgi:hypothetical protein